MAAAMIGVGEAYVDGEALPAAVALERSGLAPGLCVGGGVIILPIA